MNALVSVGKVGLTRAPTYHDILHRIKLCEYNIYPVTCQLY
jgi:hypothetical protein